MAAGKKQGHPRRLPTIASTGMAELTMKYLQLIVRFGKVRILLVIRFRQTGAGERQLLRLSF